MDLYVGKSIIIWFAIVALGLIHHSRAYVVFSNMSPSQSSTHYTAPWMKRLPYDYELNQVQNDYDDGSPEYNFSYNVEDTDGTGDSKWQRESSDSTGRKSEQGMVRGAYSLLEPDGATMRTVRYTAHPVDGFRAVVTREDVGANGGAMSAAPRRRINWRSRHY